MSTTRRRSSSASVDGLPSISPSRSGSINDQVDGHDARVEAEHDTEPPISTRSSSPPASPESTTSAQIPTTPQRPTSSSLVTPLPTTPPSPYSPSATRSGTRNPHARVKTLSGGGKRFGSPGVPSLGPQRETSDSTTTTKAAAVGGMEGKWSSTEGDEPLAGFPSIFTGKRGRVRSTSRSSTVNSHVTGEAEEKAFGDGGSPSKIMTDDRDWSPPAPTYGSAGSPVPRAREPSDDSNSEMDVFIGPEAAAGRTPLGLGIGLGAPAGGDERRSSPREPTARSSPRKERTANNLALPRIRSYMSPDLANPNTNANRLGAGLKLDTSDRALDGQNSYGTSSANSQQAWIAGLGADRDDPGGHYAGHGSGLGTRVEHVRSVSPSGTFSSRNTGQASLGVNGGGQRPGNLGDASPSASPSVSLARTFARTLSATRASATAKLPNVGVSGGRRRIKPLHYVLVGVLFWIFLKLNSAVSGTDLELLESGTASFGSGGGTLKGQALANRQAVSNKGGTASGLRGRTKHTLDEAYEDATAISELEAQVKMEAHHEEAELRRGKAIRGEKHGRGEIEQELAQRAGKKGGDGIKGRKARGSARGAEEHGGNVVEEGTPSAGTGKMRGLANQIPYAENAVGGLSRVGGYAKSLIVGSARGKVGHGAELAGGGPGWEDEDEFGPNADGSGKSSGRSTWTTPFASTGYGILQSLPGFKSAISALSPLTGGRQFSINDDETDLEEGLDDSDEPTIYRPQPEIFMQHFPGPDPDRADYREWNHAAMRDLYACLAVDNCGINQGKVALLAAHWIQMAVVQGHAQGEGVWGRSMYNALKGLGYTVILATTWEEALYRYRQMPELTKIVVRNEAGHCHYDANCVKSESNPTGIPAWKIFDFEFFPGQSTSMLKDQWLLSPDLDDHPEMNRDIQYIGYSIEEDCETRAVTPLEERDQRAWLFAKELRYLHDPNDFAWDLEFFPRVSKELDLEIVGALRPDPESRWDLKVDGVKNLGTIGATQFQHELGTSRALLGVGAPYLSPSPFVALCQGVPFINPIMSWDEDDPENRLKWNTQQPTLRWYDPPFVYNVKRGDYDGLRDALRDAMKTTIPRTILPHMKEAALRDRMMNLMETDWQARAEELLEKRKKEGGETWTM